VTAPETSANANRLFESVKAACRRTIERHRDFWLLAALTDQSFEEADHPHYRGAVARMTSCAPPVAADLRLGINGVLAAEIAAAPTELVCTHRNQALRPSRLRPDFRVVAPCGTHAALLQVKQFYDLTQGEKWRREIERDHAKYDDAHDVWRVVFFIQLPGLDYPEGKWPRTAEEVRPSRAQWVRKGGGFCGIATQLRAVQTYLGQSPAWSTASPGEWMQLRSASDAALDVARRWFAESFRPAVAWSFDPDRHLVDAAAAVAVWRPPVRATAAGDIAPPPPTVPARR